MNLDSINCNAMNKCLESWLASTVTMITSGFPSSGCEYSVSIEIFSSIDDGTRLIIPGESITFALSENFGNRGATEYSTVEPG